MTQLKTKSGTKLFDAVVETSGVTLHQEGDKVVAKIGDVTVGTVRVTKVKAKGKEISVSALIPDIDVASLIGKDPTTLSKEELIALTLHLQSGAKAAAPVDIDEDEVEETSTRKSKATSSKSKSKAPVEDEEEFEDEDEDEEDAFELPAEYDTYEKIAALGVKTMWAEIGKHIAAEAGIKARTLKDDMLEAIAEYFDLEPAEEEDDEKPAAKSKSASKSKSKPEPEEEDEDEDDFDDEDEDEDEDDFEEDEEDDFDEDEEDEDDEDDDEDEEDDEDDEDFDDEDDDEDDEDEDDEEITEEDIDNLVDAGNKQAIIKFCKEHSITLPKRKLSAQIIKKTIKDALFGEE